MKLYTTKAELVLATNKFEELRKETHKLALRTTVKCLQRSLKDAAFWGGMQWKSWIASVLTI